MKDRKKEIRMTERMKPKKRREDGKEKEGGRKVGIYQGKRTSRTEGRTF